MYRCIPHCMRQYYVNPRDINRLSRRFRLYQCRFSHIFVNVHYTKQMVWEENMAQANTTFELTVDDLELIETALIEKKRTLSLEMLDSRPSAKDEPGHVRTIQDLLGRLHNQKEFYRPKRGVYVGG